MTDQELIQRAARTAAAFKFFATAAQQPRRRSLGAAAFAAFDESFRVRDLPDLAAIFAAPWWLFTWFLTLGRFGRPIIELREAAPMKP